jgi:ribosomal protein S18 acetylase RimI-like enzyme
MIDTKTTSGPAARAADGSGSGVIQVRSATLQDLCQVIAIDTEVTGIEKVDYWYELFHRFFLVAADGSEIVGFIIGEVRDWEFGSPPCGWVFGLSVKPSARLGGIATLMLETICAGFARSGVKKVRTLLSRDNGLVMSFFRSQGMVAAPVIALERDL